jgi:cell division protein FtsW (lipid II flippase)
VFLAGYLEQKRALLSVATHRVGPFLLPPPRHLGPVLAAAGAALGIMVLQRDLGSSLLFFGVFIVLLYVATGRLAYPAIGGLAFAVGATIAYHVFGHVRLRVAIWLDPWSRIDNEGYQLAQSLFAMGTGGLTGTGLGLGRPSDIPFASTDAIFSVLAEELGLLGATATLALFLVVVARGYKTALSARDEVGTLLAAGLTTILGFQVFVIVGGLTRLVPFTGITLPFVSYGGSSLVSNYILLALVLRVSDDARGSVAGARRTA